MPELVEGPNETEKDLDNRRKDSLKNFISKKKFGKKDDEGGENPENKKKSDKELDIDEKNSYIDNKNNSDDGEEPKGEEPKGEETPEGEESSNDLDKYEEILDKTFGGDPKKAVKSWQEASKNFTKLRKQAQEYEQELSYLEELVQKNPTLGKVIKTAAEKGELTNEDLQNFLSEGNREPQGKPSSASDKSKLEIVDKDLDVKNIDEKTLVQSGYLDSDQKESLSPSEWSLLKRQAALSYAEDQLPQKMAQKAVEQFEQQIEAKEQAKQQEKQRDQIQKTNAERYEKGIDRVINDFNLDFAGNEEHQEMLNDIESLAVNIRDPKNKDVIHPNAIYLAAQEVMREKGMSPGSSVDVDNEVEKKRQEVDETFDKRSGFNANTRQPSDDKPKTLADKLAARNRQQYQEEQDKRIKTGRISGSE